MLGGRRQSNALTDDMVPVNEVQSLLARAKHANARPKSPSSNTIPSTPMPATDRHEAKNKSPQLGFGGRADRGLSPVSQKQKLVLPGPPSGGGLSAKLNARTGEGRYGKGSRDHIISREEIQQREADTNSPTRVSSKGTVLRRGSQVGVAPRRHVRQYRHPRDMEAALIDSEAKIALLEDKLDATTAVLRRTQDELLQRNADLEAAGIKTNSLMLMVRELLQHVVEKREGRRFSEAASAEIEKVMNAPLQAFQEQDDLKEYIGQKINAIDNLLPQWTSLPSAFMDDVDREDFESEDEEDDGMAMPPPLPPGVLARR